MAELLHVARLILRVLLSMFGAWFAITVLCWIPVSDLFNPGALTGCDATVRSATNCIENIVTKFALAPLIWSLSLYRYGGVVLVVAGLAFPLLAILIFARWEHVRPLMFADLSKHQ